MKTKEIHELIDCITKSGLEEVRIETENVKIHVKRNMSIPAHLAPLAPNAPLPSIPTEIVENSRNYITIKSPMIGTFYRSPNPEESPFVREGDAIVKGTKLCIIEAMKLYNEIESEVTGKIVQILVDDVSPVEYDQPLFVVDPVTE